MVANDESLLPPTPLPLGIEREPAVGLPLLVSWVALVAYVAGVARVSGPEQHADVQFRLMEIERNINKNKSACHDFYNYSCGNYRLHNALDPWQKASIIASHKIQETPMYKECASRVDFFEDKYIWDDDVSSGEEPCYLQCRLRMLYRGVTVNGVTARAAESNKKVVMMYWTNHSETINETAPWGTHGLLRSPDVVARLTAKDDAEFEVPEDYPDTCTQAVQEYSFEALAKWFLPATQATVLAERLMEHFDAGVRAASARFKQYQPPRVRIGGGRGLVPDSEWLDSNLDMWQARRLLESQRVGEDVGGAWFVPASMVNAFYDSDAHAVFIPSMITKEPFMADSYSESLQYGGLGFVIAHELGHAIDYIVNDTGYRHMLGHRLAEMSDALYSQVNHTEREAVADTYGLRLLEATHQPNRITMLQTAQLWCMSAQTFSNDTHPPGRWRVNSTFGASLAWSRVFCKHAHV